MDVRKNGKDRENDICRISLTVEGVSRDKTEMERGWCKMESILKDLNLLRNCDGIIAWKWHFKYLLNEQMMGRCINDGLLPFSLFYYLALKANYFRGK